MQGNTIDIPSAADLRAARARAQVEIYVLAARARLHPGRLGRYLNGALPLTSEIAARISAALQESV